jgi:hypothetical protein
MMLYVLPHRTNKRGQSNAITNILGRSDATTTLLIHGYPDATLVDGQNPRQRVCPPATTGRKVIPISNYSKKATRGMTADVSSRARRWLFQIKFLMYRGSLFFTRDERALNLQKEFSYEGSGSHDHSG